MKKTRLCCTSLFVTCALLLTSCGDRYHVFDGYAQGGRYAVKANLKGVRVPPSDLQRGIDSILTVVDMTLSGYNKSSVLSRYNNGENVDTSGIFSEMLKFSREMYVLTDGALDVASAALFDLWGFGFTNDTLPSASRVREVLEECGMEHFDKHPKLNFNAVAQGYTSDLIADYLHGFGIEDMLVDIGEIYCEGVNPYGKPWAVGVERPFDGNDGSQHDLTIVWESSPEGQGIVTSGNYRKYYVRDGKKYAHTIDPRTGYPVDHNLLSATIVASTASEADAYATYCMVIGLEQARAFIESHSEIEGYLIFDENGEMKEWVSSGFTTR